MQDPHIIRTLEQLREVIPAPNPATQRKVTASMDEHARGFIAASPFVLVATTDRQFKLDVSPKGDLPGFVRVVDAHTLLLPERTGNRLAYGFANLLETGSIALIFMIPGVRETLRISGTATITRDPALLQSFAVEGKPALLCTRVVVEECFFHCAKALIRSRLWQPGHWVEGDARDAAVKQWAASFGASETDIRRLLEQDYRDNL